MGKLKWDHLELYVQFRWVNMEQSVQFRKANTEPSVQLRNARLGINHFLSTLKTCIKNLAAKISKLTTQSKSR